MKTDLPEPAEYYRPTRAGELRVKAERAEWWADRVLQPLAQWGCGVCALSWLAAVLIPRLLGYNWLFAAGGFGAPAFMMAMALLQIWVSHRGKAYRARAAILEAEHASRYGALPPGEKP